VQHRIIQPVGLTERIEEKKTTSEKTGKTEYRESIKETLQRSFKIHLDGFGNRQGLTSLREGITGDRVSFHKSFPSEANDEEESFSEPHGDNVDHCVRQGENIPKPWMTKIFRKIVSGKND
jgi:hypothetical protein